MALHGSKVELPHLKQYYVQAIKRNRLHVIVVSPAFMLRGKYRDFFVIQFCGVIGGGNVCRRHTLYSGQYLKNGLSDLIQIWHVDVTAYQGVLYSLVTLNSH